MMAVRNSQPFLHDLVTSVAAPALALSSDDGQIRPGGASGVYVADRRIASRCVLRIDGAEPAPMRGQSERGGSRFVSTVRSLGDGKADPTVLVERRRELRSDGMRETITIRSYAREPFETTVELAVDCDLADVASVKNGACPEALPATVLAGADGPGLRWRVEDGTTATLRVTPPPQTVNADGLISWPLRIGPDGSAQVRLEWTGSGGPPAAVLGLTRPERASATLEVHACDARLPALLTQSLDDIAGLQLADPLEPADRFLAAGAPWFLTLFGRDSIWAARMLLPLGTELAAGTLRTLARRQGRRVDMDTAEEPGKILHEIRRGTTQHTTGHGGNTMVLPPLYYGTVDATPLWVSLLHDAWRWGLPDDQVRPLLPALDRALAWLRDYGAGPDGFLTYVDRTGHGLANQGWKDSFDSVQFRDGQLAEGPVALCEVQAYAHAAARQGADLLDAFDRPGAEMWRAWADQLRARFCDRFWVERPDGAYPAIALDGRGRPVDSVTSNLGHLLGTGLLDEAETELVVRRLASPELDCGFGLRTLASDSAGFNPVSYHGGSVWSHDTAIAISGLAAVGSPSAGVTAASLIHGLLRAGDAFAFRLPEVHGGEQHRPGLLPIPYPAACRPQAWSAAAAMTVLTAVLGVRPDVPNGTVSFAPLNPSPVGPVTVDGLRVAGAALDVRLGADGSVTVGSALRESS